ncbi:MAG: tyrosine-type recombinase/integrase [Candidatus Babeliaceae bacterium]|nr:tyrosine-type recombinase/integrase [Candidatus Babeliaceae bacterium]
MGCAALKTEAFFSHVEPFMDYRKTVYEVSDETVRSNRADLALFEHFLKRRRIETITGPAVMNFQVWLKTERENSGASINRKIFTLRSYGKYMRLAEPESAKDLPFQDVLKIRQGYREPPQALNIDQLKAFFESIDRTTCLGIRDYAVYALMYGLGLRVGEIHRLNLDNIDLKENTLHAVGKGRKRRELSLTGELPRILAEYLAVRSHFMNSQTSGALFLSKKGNRLSIRTMEDNFRKIFARSEIMVWFHVTCHTLRHSFASHLNDEGVDILVLQSLLGHASPKSTQIYIHPSMQRMREALENLPAVVYMTQLVEEMRFQSKARYRPNHIGIAMN